MSHTLRPCCLRLVATRKSDLVMTRQPACFVSSKLKYYQVREDESPNSPTHTWVLERRYTARLHKIGEFPDLRKRHLVYEVVEHKNNPLVKREPELLKVLLVQYVEDVGQAGEIVEIPKSEARELILLKRALYPTPYNLEHFADKGQAKSYSSRYAKKTMEMLSRTVVGILMSNENPWTLEPWHVKQAFRKEGIIVRDDAISLPDQPITGPPKTPEEEGKEFDISVTINKTERVTVHAKIL